MSKPRARSAACRSSVALVAIAFAFAIGCASVRPIGPGEPLRGSEGLLVVQMRTEVPLRSITISGARLPLDLSRGSHLLLVAVSAGSYRWSGLDVELSTSSSREGEAVKLVYRDHPDLRFRVEAGRLNYPGMLEVYDHGWTASLRSVDRAALAIGEIRSTYPSLLERYAIVYSGSARHVFLERYLAAQSTRSTAAPATDPAR